MPPRRYTALVPLVLDVGAAAPSGLDVGAAAPPGLDVGAPAPPGLDVGAAAPPGLDVGAAAPPGWNCTRMLRPIAVEYTSRYSTGKPSRENAFAFGALPTMTANAGTVNTAAAIASRRRSRFCTALTTDVRCICCSYRPFRCPRRMNGGLEIAIAPTWLRRYQTPRKPRQLTNRQGLRPRCRHASVRGDFRLGHIEATPDQFIQRNPINSIAAEFRRMQQVREEPPQIHWSTHGVQHGFRRRAFQRHLGLRYPILIEVGRNVRWNLQERTLGNRPIREEVLVVSDPAPPNPGRGSWPGPTRRRSSPQGVPPTDSPARSDRSPGRPTRHSCPAC